MLNKIAQMWRKVACILCFKIKVFKGLKKGEEIGGLGGLETKKTP
jgi:hypothetical protein